MVEALIADAKGHGMGITFDLSGIGKAKAAVLHADTFKSISDAGDTLRMKFPALEIVLDNDALEALTHTAGFGAEPVAVNAAVVPMGQLAGMQAAQTFDYDKVVDVEALIGHTKLNVPMTISMPYKLKPGEDPAAVCAWFMNDDGDLTRLEGVYNAASGMISFSTLHQSCFVVGYDPVALWKNVFGDVSKDARYYDAVAYANYYKLFNGYGHGRFMPSEKMSRAMFATVLWNMDGMPSARLGRSFSDVPYGTWFHDAVVWAVECGIVPDPGSGAFGPNRAITRQEMVLMMSNFAKMNKYDIPKNRTVQPFADNGIIDASARDAAKALAEAGVINSIGGKFNPGDGATRYEAAIIVKNFARFVVARAAAK